MSGMSRLHVRQEIQKLNRLDPNRASYEAISATFRKITKGLGVDVIQTSAAELFYRARFADEKPKSVSELKAAPAEKVKGYQRCNPPGIPMFYAASKRLGALSEIRVTEGCVVYLSQWIAPNRLPVNKIFDGEENEIVASNPTSTISGPNDDILLAYFDTLFTKRIHVDYSDEYKFTSAIAQQLTSHFSENDKQGIHADGYVALKYPSVLGLDSWHNTVMHPSFAEKRLELLHVMELRIVSCEEMHVQIEVLDTAVSFCDGKIEWTSNPNNIPMLLNDNKDIPFVYNGGTWKLALFDSPITPEYLDTLLLD